LPPKPEELGRVVASPAVRRLARELDVDLRGVTGTGRGGAITKDDVHAASRRSPESAEG
jgi:pyruvate/2-oxoglutarate dehydrogenase complex dihydrolipoamide acyltransferase (E2) component